MAQDKIYDTTSKYIIDKWLDECVPLTDLIQAYLTQTEISAFEFAAKIAEEEGLPQLAAKYRKLKPKKYIFKNKPVKFDE